MQLELCKFLRRIARDYPCLIVRLSAKFERLSLVMHKFFVAAKTIPFCRSAFTFLPRDCHDVTCKSLLARPRVTIDPSFLLLANLVAERIRV